MSIRLASLLIVSFMLASAIAFLQPMTEEEPLVAGIMQTEDTGAISAFVTDDVGRFIVGAAVTIVGTNLTYTNETGYALIEHLPTDLNWTHYTVYASKEGYYSSAVVDVTVSPGNITNVTLEIMGGTLYGIVQDALGPVFGANVSILSLGYSDTTNVDGVYSIEGVPGDRTHFVKVSAPGYDNQTDDIFMDTGGFEILNFLLVSQTGTILGTVRHASTDEGLFNVSVSVRVGTVTLTTMTEPDGTYDISSLPSGTYTVTATLTGFESASLSGIVVLSGGITENVDFLLVEKPTKLYGIVRSGTFLVPGVLITVIGADLFTNTSIDGEYEITNITVGTYDVMASLEGYVPMTITGVIIQRGGEVVANFNLQSIPGSSLSGLVLSSRSNSPLSGVEVVVLGLATQRSTITNIYGQFEVTGLIGGNYTVRFVLNGYQPKELELINVAMEGETTLEQVMLEPISESFGGFIFGFDLAHSMMILALFLTIIILALAVMLRIRTFESPEKAPAVYDQDEPQEDEVAIGHERREEPAREKDRPKRKEKKRK